ncbi:hypothetical protein ERJ75_000734600 [Trypanosoma vivax]|uniref:Uncharacterized protein n=1 Tax=Trypanosoma vivax (strain Y486) TaxID=1055687 RepID=G0TXA7_TRYVY|nr:hypothetical protein TRVL_05445 [Trypanosoma vivax]KAH8614114.1 hypothetical protein ERJ75_000734600 [Trypanosoma vivax]CCC48597.1 conserved hypothetical protein [Trypanosoma vivax Y486]
MAPDTKCETVMLNSPSLTSIASHHQADSSSLPPLTYCAKRSFNSTLVVESTPPILRRFPPKQEGGVLSSIDCHRIMVKQLLLTAYEVDPCRRANASKWRSLLNAVDEEFAIARSRDICPYDPYEEVLAKVSSMMLWNEKLRCWTYGYSVSAFADCHTRRCDVLRLLKESGKLFLV